MFRQLTAAALLLALVADCSNAFDTGHHSDMTRAALSRRQFSDHAIKAVQVANWLADYITNSPTILKANRDQMEELHFDNLNTTAKVDNYWRNLAANTRVEIRRLTTVLNQNLQNPKKKQEALTNLLVVIGISLHAVQDFYSHSNWVETHYPPAAPEYQTMTYWREFAALVPPPVPPNQRAPDPHYWTGWYKGRHAANPEPNEPNQNNLKHGRYDDPATALNTPNHGFLNHDSYCRPRWERAYVFAYAGTLEWIDAVITWADGVAQGLLTQELSTYNLANGLPGMPTAAVLDANLGFAKSISEYVKEAPDDGHWKGKGSGHTAFKHTALAWVPQDSPWKDTLKSGLIQAALQKALINHLYDPFLPNPFYPPPGQTVPTGYAIKIRTTRVTKPNNQYVFARITVDEGLQNNVPQNPITYDEALVVTPNGQAINPLWQTIHFVDANVSQVRITYKLVAREQVPGNILGVSVPNLSGENRCVLNNNHLPDGEYILDYDFSAGGPLTLGGDFHPSIPAINATLRGVNRSATISVTHELLR